MKKYSLLAIATAASIFCLAQNNVGIGTTSPHASALLDLSSSTKGLLLPRMTGTQRNGIGSPAKGLLVFDTDLNSLMFYNGSAWQSTQSGGTGSGLQLPYDTTGEFSGRAIQITNTATSVSGATIRAMNTGGTAISASTQTGQTAIRATNTDGNGVFAQSTSGDAIAGSSGSGAGVYGFSTNGPGLQGASVNNNGVYGQNTANGTGVYGNNPNAGKGVWGRSNTGIGVYGDVSGTGGTAGKFVNNLLGYGLEVEGRLKFSGTGNPPAAGKILTSDASGNATWQKPLASKVGFSASQQASGGWQTIPANTWGKLSWVNEHHDPGNDFYTYTQTPASVFVVPVNGFYQFNAMAQLVNGGFFSYLGHGMRFRLERNGVISTFAEQTFKYGEEVEEEATPSLSGAFRLNAGDKIWVEVIGYSSTDYIAIQDVIGTAAFFNGFLIHED